MTDLAGLRAKAEAAVRTAIADPGAFLPRGDNYTEPIPSWSARAVMESVVIGLLNRIQELENQLSTGGQS